MGNRFAPAALLHQAKTDPTVQLEIVGKEFESLLPGMERLVGAL